MPVVPPPPSSISDPALDVRPRPAWRERLIEAERGFVGGFRNDSALFVQFFQGCLTLAAGLVFGLQWLEWGIVILCLTVNVTTELFHQALRALLSDDVHPLRPSMVRGLGMARAAALMSAVGSTLAILFVLCERIQQG